MSSDEPALRRFFNSLGFDGQASVCFKREPDFFLGRNLLGERAETLVCRHGNDIVGMISHAYKKIFINGSPKTVYYLSDMRIVPSYRHKGPAKLLLETIRPQAEAMPTLFTIISDNVQGNLLTRRHAHVRRIGNYHSLLVAPWRRKKTTAACGQDEDWEEIKSCISRNAVRYNFYPDELYGMRPKDFLVVRQAGKIVGVTAIWDQQGFKQTYATGYRGRTKLMKTAYDIVAKTMGFAPLPDPGKPYKYFFLGLTAIDEDDKSVFKDLMNAASNQVFAKGYGFFMVGLTHNSPFLADARKYLHFSYDSEIYAMGPSLELDDRPLYLEIGAL